MRTGTVLVAAFVLLAGVSTGFAASDAPEAYAAQNDAQDETEVQYQDVTIRELSLDNVTIQQGQLNETELRGNGTDESKSLGTVTASNLTVENATLRNVTFREVTFRDQAVVDQLFGDDGPPEGDSASVENATLSDVSIQSLAVDSSAVGAVEVNDVNASVSPATGDADAVSGQPAIAARNLTVENGTVESIEADRVGVENASAGIGMLLNGDVVANAPDDRAGEGTDSTEKDGEVGALRAPER